MSDLVRETHDLLAEEAHRAVEAGWAEVWEDEGVIGPAFHLEPVKINAAPLELYFDSDLLVVCYPGRNSMVVEFFSEDPEEIKRQVRALAAAVVNGTYSERLKEGATESEAEWPGPEGTERAKRKLLQVPGIEHNRWRTVEYEPY